MRPWRVALGNQVFGSLAVGVMLLIAAILFSIQNGLGPIVEKMRHEQTITAFLDPALEAKDISKITDSIQTSLGASVEVDIKTVTAQEFAEKMKANYPDLFHELESLGQELNSLTPRYISISGVLSGEDLEKIRTQSGVESVETSRDRYKHVIGLVSAIRTICGILIFGILLALATGMTHLMKLNSTFHAETIQLLKLWGANALTLKGPGMISGSLVGLIGGAIALIGWFSIGHRVMGQVRSLSPLFNSFAHPSAWVAIILFFSGILIGLISGAQEN